MKRQNLDAKVFKLIEGTNEIQLLSDGRGAVGDQLQTGPKAASTTISENTVLLHL